LGIKETNLRLWEAYIKLGNSDEAEKQKNILINTENKEELTEILFFCRKYRLFETMLVVGKKLVESRKESSLTYFSIGYALNQLGDYEGALRYFEKEETISVVYAISKINIGISYWGLKKYEKANDCFKDAYKELNKKPTSGNFSPVPPKSKARLALNVWLKIMFGSLPSALHSIEEYLRSKDIDMDEFYDLRDWGAVVKRFPEHLPEGFDDFYERINNILLDFDSNSIYKLNIGI
jgi:tetratricopeptide (TPR) repeat protein